MIRPLPAAGLLACAWLLPIAAQALRADWLLLVAALLGTGSLLRGGYFLLDRLMLACILLAGTLVAGGLLFSAWPSGLRPVPVAGTLLTVLVAVGLLTGRRPRLPLRFRGTDAVIAGAGVIAALIMLGPVAGRSFSQRLLYTTGVEDKYAHFALFDAIHRLGGYTFLSPGRATGLVTASTANVYPQGSHYLYAILDIFLRSTTSPGPALAEFSRYYTLTLIGFGFLVLAVTWSARWVAGPVLSGWRAALVCSAVATLTALGPLTGLIRFAFDSETTGLALLALCIAVAARPAGRAGEQMLLVAAALIAVWYAYNLYGVLATLSVTAAVVVYRRRLRRHWLFAVVTASVALPVALLPSILAELSGFSANRQLMTGGDVIPLNPYLVTGLALLACAGMAVRAGRRSGAWRAYTAYLALAAVVIAVLRIYQLQSLGSQTDYYFAKLLTGGYVSCLVGFGTAGLLLDAAASRLNAAGNQAAVRRSARGRAQPVASVAAGLAALLLASGLLLALPGVRHGKSDYTEAWAYRWWSGREKLGPGAALQVAGRARLLADGRPTFIIYTNTGIENWRASFFAAVLNHDLGAMKNAFSPLLMAAPVVGPITSRRARARTDYDIAIIERAIAGGPRHIQVIVSSERLATRLRVFAAAHPGLSLTVVYLPRMRPAPASRERH